MKNGILKKHENIIIHVMIVYAILGLTLKIAIGTSTWVQKKMAQVPPIFFGIYCLIGSILLLYMTIETWMENTNYNRIKNIFLTLAFCGVTIYHFIDRGPLTMQSRGLQEAGHFDLPWFIKQIINLKVSVCPCSP